MRIFILNRNGYVDSAGWLLMLLSPHRPIHGSEQGKLSTRTGLAAPSPGVSTQAGCRLWRKESTLTWKDKQVGHRLLPWEENPGSSLPPVPLPPTPGAEHVVCPLEQTDVTKNGRGGAVFPREEPRASGLKGMEGKPELAFRLWEAK